jgi:hypothetical protein
MLTGKELITVRMGGGGGEDCEGGEGWPIEEWVGARETRLVSEVICTQEIFYQDPPGAKSVRGEPIEKEPGDRRQSVLVQSF